MPGGETNLAPTPALSRPPHRCQSGHEEDGRVPTSGPGSSGLAVGSSRRSNSLVPSGRAGHDDAIEESRGRGAARRRRSRDGDTT